MNVKAIAFSVAMAAGLLVNAPVTMAAEELVVTSLAKSANAAVAIDIVTEGSATAIQFNIALPKGDCGAG